MFKDIFKKVKWSAVFVGLLIATSDLWPREEMSESTKG